MRKFFTLALAAFASLSMWADDEIIQVTLSGDKGATSTVSGTIGGTCAVDKLSSSSPYKLNSDGAYVSATLATGYFEPTDMVIIDDADRAHEIYYGDPASGTKLLTTAAPVSGQIKARLSGLPANQNTIYVGRSSGTYNGKLSKLTVSRPEKAETGDATISYTMTKGGAAVAGDVLDGAKLITTVTTCSEFTVSTLKIESSDAQDNYCGRITGQAEGFSESNFVQLSFTVADGYVFRPSAAGITIKANSSAMKAKVLISDGTTDIESEELECASSDKDVEFGSTAFDGVELKGDVLIKVYFWGVTGKRAYIKTPLTLEGEVALGCTPPTDPLKLTLDTVHAVATDADALYVGDKVIFKFSGGNGGGISYTSTGAGGSLEPDGSGNQQWTAAEGECEFVCLQGEQSGVCGARIKVTLKGIAKTPVTAATVSGPTTTFVDKEITLTCESDKATNYQWYKDGIVIAGATSATYSFSADAAGTLVFYCETWNKFNTDENHAKSNNLTITVTEGASGELIKAVHTGETTADVTGVIGGTVDKKTQGNGKLGSNGHYFGIKLADGNFKVGDKVLIHASTTSEIVQIFSDKGENMINEGTFDENKDYRYKLTEETDWIYLYRTSAAGSKMNPVVEFISVTRPDHPESSDATLKSLKVGEAAITLEADKYAYEYELAADFAAEQVAVSFELNDSHATADKTSPVQVLTPEAGASQEVKITVTAEDGTKAEYSVKISRAEAPKSEECSIIDLLIEHEIVKAVSDTFAYVVPASVDLAEVEVVFTISDKATSDMTSPFKMAVPEPDVLATTPIVVTAEDGVHTHKYFVCITKAKAVDPDDPDDPGDEAIDNIGDGVQAVKFFENGQLVIIKNGVKYNAQGAIVR